MGMVVLKRRRNQRIIAERDGRRLYVNLCELGSDYALLGFEGPYTVLREELLGIQRPPIVHLAGEQIQIGSYRLQRCLLCGEVLEEYDVDRTEDDHETQTFLPGHFYEFDDRKGVLELNGSSAYRFDLRENLPTNCCLLETLEDEK